MALSRVRSLSNLHLTQFDPASIIVSTSCLEEINRLRSMYRKDISLYDVPKTKNSCNIDEEAPPLKKPCMDKQKCKRKISTQEESPKTKKAKTQAGKNDDDIIYTGTVSTVSCQHTTWHNLRYYPVNEEWQRQACNILGLEFVAVSNCARDGGGPDTLLTRPDHRSLKRIVGNGNCLFRALCYIITGSEQQHFDLRSAIT